MKRLPRLIATALTLTLAAALTQAQITEEVPVNNSDLGRELFYQLLIGEISAQNGDIPSAYALMMDAARKSNSPRLYERAVEIALRARNGESALQAALAWGRTFPAASEPNRYQLQILIGLNKVSETLEPIKRELINLKGAERQLFISMLPRFFARVTEKTLAVTVVEQALSKEFSSPTMGPTAWSTMGRMRYLAGDLPGALDAAQRGVALNATAEDPVLLAIELMQTQTPAAEAIVRNYLSGKPVPELRMVYARKLLDSQRFGESYEQMQLLTQEKPQFADAWLVKGSLEFQEKKWTAAEASLNAYVALFPPGDDPDTAPETGRGVVQAYLLLAQVAEITLRPEVAVAHLKRINSPQDALRVQVRLAAILAKQGKLEDALALIRNAPEVKPEDARAKLGAEVQLLRDGKQYAAAYRLLDDAIARFPQDVDFIYDQAMLADKIGKYQEMEALLRQVIAAKPDYHHAYNALGYSMADRKVNLPEARQLVQKALEFSPNDPYIVDSLAWVEFRSGNASEALRLLKLAFQARPDAEIAAHMGEVLWHMGQFDEARRVWSEGKTLNPDNDTLLETTQRLTSKP